MAYLRCSPKKEKEKKKKKGLYVYKGDRLNRDICYLGEKILHYEFTGASYQYATLYVENGDTRSSINIANVGTNGGIFLSAIRFIDTYTIAIFYQIWTPSTEFYPITYCRYITLDLTGVLTQSANVAIIGAETADVSRRAIITKQFRDGSGDQLAVLRISDTYNSSTGYTTESIGFVQGWWNPASKALTFSASEASLASGLDAAVYQSAKLSLTSIFNYRDNSLNDKIYFAPNYQSTNRNIMSNIYISAFGSIGILSDGRLFAIKMLSSRNITGYIFDINLGSTTDNIKTIQSNIELVNSSSVGSIDILSLVNNILLIKVTLRTGYTSFDILGKTKPEGYYRIEINKNSEEEYYFELLDDFVEVGVGQNVEKTHSKYWGAGSDPFNDVFIYDID